MLNQQSANPLTRAKGQRQRLLLRAFPVGLLAGLSLGVLFNRTLLITHRWMARLRYWPVGASGLLVGALVGLVGWFLPEAVGSGAPLTGQVLAAEIGWRSALQYLLLRFPLTMVSYGSGAAGGIIAPLLLFGALLGVSTASLSQPCGCHSILPSNNWEPRS